MTASVVLLAIGYAAVAALLLSLNLATRFAFAVKTGAICLVSGLYATTWFGLDGLLGWATPAALPEEFRVLWIVMDEPDKATRVPGSIFFWVRTLDDAGLPAGAPRAYRVAWTEAGAEAAQAALAGIEQGELLNGRLGHDLVTDDDAREEGADYAGQRSLSGSGGEPPNFEFVRVPPPALPPKSTPTDFDPER